MKEVKRKGARSAKDIPVSILEQLNKGEIESANLVEWLAVDQIVLLKNVLNELNKIEYLEPVLIDVRNLKKQTVNTINEAIGTGILKQSVLNNDLKIVSIISKHKSDLVRCWSAYAIGRNSKFTIEEMLEQIQFLAADKHFGVREISWLAVRHNITKNLDRSFEILLKWTSSEDENIRRFATEAIRPRGVWCEHIEELKKKPESALKILDLLKSDSSKYVQDSVGNWLNDASKSRPDFVKDLCQKWQTESPTKETAYIIKKALRTIEK
ncbi:DNA alkylation repair protein [Flavobacterium johnsoniae]|uniref:DNA alkylation repair enzyme-like protein n=1 Tax=Flavobacterium johnsoniae (strain ATCC 17061 / DSM 2064 / JCM 8514 / BCRC 14874 / CCUG 350202 / NBRC 14942 / NCIMB 11054 / UW101) TaxID=376686 RepID=A5FH07_FLAJ1|nr:DNA alkylation repair protein [Flavobacterium johnsoniae]ABQ05512.1 DNA alkylation repair enzyme-like protein [Flavobacterium johnsoniae UW101]OXE96759.1 DNA alkylation repair protein [Flavobacterium johnsoniae UW101]WQG82686.1 DNA alkylation repair protein [Flavobacterium johnsoniae UW101]SHL55066.1 3-methyladenine DNA glycosylase AlkC [Flavobacterium johnsoniae]